MDLPEPNPISPTAENVAFTQGIARAHYGVPLPGEIVAGRELDAMVAEKVMGWPVDGISATVAYRERNMPAFSTEIVAAWQVVEKLRERFPQIDIEILADRVTVTLWEQCRHDGAALNPLDEVVADTAPLAICRAALQAVGVVPESV